VEPDPSATVVVKMGFRHERRGFAAKHAGQLVSNLVDLKCGCSFFFL
jgi:hypothetical protein